MHIGKARRAALFLFPLLTLGAIAPVVTAVPASFTETDDLASMTFDTATGVVTSLSNNGIEHVGAGGLRYFYRIGSSGPESPLVSGSVLSYLDTPVLATFDIKYNFAGNFSVEYRYSLTGAGTNFSSLDPKLYMRSDSLSDQDVHIFAYRDFDLQATNTDQSAAITGGPAFNLADQFDPTDLNPGLGFDDPLVAGPRSHEAMSGGHGEGLPLAGPTHWMIGDATTLLTSLTDGSATSLTDNTSSSGAGDLAYVFEYQFTLAAKTVPFSDTSNSLFYVTPQIRIKQPSPDIGQPVPEPMSAALALAGFGVLGLTIARRSALNRVNCLGSCFRD